MLRTIEARKTTSEPLVEISIADDGRDGPFAPAGRRFAQEPRADGLNSYGLTDVELVAYQNACDRLRGLADQHYTDPDLSAAMMAAGLTSASPLEQREAFVAKYRREHGMPTAFQPLALGDPSNNYESIPDAAPRATPAAPIAHVDQLTAAAAAPSAGADPHVLVPGTHVDFLHQLLEAVEPGAEQVAVSAFKVAFEKVFKGKTLSGGS